MHKIVNGIEVPLSEEEINEHLIREQEHLDRVESDKLSAYKHARKEAYPRLEDQLDLIFHGGLEEWKSAIQAVKDRFPKPE